MKYVAWLWSFLMLAGIVFAASQGSSLGLWVPRNLLLGMAFSAIIAFPPLWRAGGPLADSGLPGMSRAILALALPAICGLVGTAYGLDAFIHPAIA